MKEAVLKDRRLTVRDLREMIPNVSKTCIDKILTDHLGYAKVHARTMKPMARNSWTPLSVGARAGPLHDIGNETTILSMETSIVAEDAEV
ncbi:hypothetical protein Trydic_g22477 [Trypoxylus dichotomus]